MIDFIDTEYSDIITMTAYRNPNYQVIDFQKFLERKLSVVQNFISADIIKSLRDKIIAEYNNDKSCFNEFGTLSEISFKDLHYYQNEVGISGPKHNNIDEPVAILNVDNESILWNGYHRAFLKIANNNTTIKGYILTISN
jgi:hypothetical protein